MESSLGPRRAAMAGTYQRGNRMAPASPRDLADCGLDLVGGTRFELVTSSVSGRSDACQGVPECSGEHFTWPNTAPRCPGMPQGLRRMAPALAPALALVATCNGTIDAGIPPLGHDTT